MEGWWAMWNMWRFFPPGRCEPSFMLHLWMFPKIVGFPPKSSHFNRVFPLFINHPFWGKHPYFWETSIWRMGFGSIPRQPGKPSRRFKHRSPQGIWMSKETKDEETLRLQGFFFPKNPWDWYIYLHLPLICSIFTCIWLKFTINVGKYTSPMGLFGLLSTLFLRVSHPETPDDKKRRKRGSSFPWKPAARNSRSNFPEAEGEKKTPPIWPKLSKTLIPKPTSQHNNTKQNQPTNK